MKLNYKKDLPSKWVWWVLIILAICCFKGCAKASSLNISDFDYEIFTSSANIQSRTCTNSWNLQSQQSTFVNAYTDCTISFSESEWNNNFKKNDYNFLIFPVIHQAYGSNTSTSTSTITSFQYIVDYTLKIYLKDVNNRIYNCDIVNDSMAMCRYDRNSRIVSITTEILMLGGNSTSVNGQIFGRIYYQSQYYLSTYGNVKESVQIIKDSILDSNVDTNSSGNNAISQFQSLIPTNGTITNLVLLPLNLVNAYSVGMSGTCSALNLGTIFGTEIILPCISMQNLVGSTLWGIIDIIVGGLMVFAIGKKMVRVFNDLTSLRDNQIDELYGGGA